MEIGDKEWTEMCQRRAELIMKDISCTISPSEKEELERLDNLSSKMLEEKFPYQPNITNEELDLKDKLLNKE